MPKLRDLMTSGGGAPTTGTVKLRDLTAAPSFRVEDLPTVGGMMGYSPEFSEATGLGFTDSFGPAAADIFGNYQDVANSIAKRVPGAKLVRDANGYEVLELPDGKRFAMNRPGTQGHEVASLAGRILGFMPAGKLASLPTALSGRVATGAAAAGATDMAMQKVAGRESIDPAQTAVSASLGGGAELLAPLLRAAGNKAVDWLRSDANAKAVGAQLAKQFDLGPMDDAALVELGRRSRELAGGAKPSATAGEAEFGLKYTSGQKTGDFKQLAREEMLAESQTMGGEMMRQAQREGARSVDSALEAIRARMSGGQAPTSVSSGVGRVVSGIGDAYRQAKGKVDELYSAARQQKAAISREGLSGLPQQLRRAVGEMDIATQTHPAAAKALERITATVQGLPKEVTAVTLRAIERERRILNNDWKAAVSPADREAVRRLRDAYDTWVGEAIDNALVSGSPAALEALKAARAARSDLGVRFERQSTTDAAGRLIERMTKSKASPEEFATALLGSSQVSKPVAATFAARIKQALGSDTNAWNQLRSTVLLKATTKPTGEALGPQAIVSNLKTMLRERPELLNTLYSAKERAALGRLVSALEPMLKQGSMARSSGTAERVMRYLGTTAHSVPLVGDLLRQLASLGQAGRALAPISPPRPALLPASILGASPRDPSSDRPEYGG